MVTRRRRHRLLGRARDQHGLGAEPRQRRGDGMALLARGAVGDDSARGRSARGSGRWSPGRAGRSAPRRREEFLDRGDDLQRLGHAAHADSPQARSPASGPTWRTPRAVSVAKFACVAACSHIMKFIAGATSTGLSVASSVVEARSSAMPAAICAMRSAWPGRRREDRLPATGGYGPSRSRRSARRDPIDLVLAAGPRPRAA